MSRLNVANFRHPDGTADNLNLTSTGRVGIGTASPAQAPTVDEGTIRVESGSAASHYAANSGGAFITTESAIPLQFYTNKTKQAEITSGGNLQFNSGYGSVATAYGVRAWVNFEGTGTAAIKEDGGISSFTDVDTGKYTISFSTTMPDANYCPIMGICNDSYAGTVLSLGQDGPTGSVYSKTTTQLQFRVSKNGGDFGVVDVNEVSLAIIR